MWVNKLAKALTVIFLIFIIWIIYTANTGGSHGLFNLVAAIPFGDKLGHFLIFGVLTLGGNHFFSYRCFTLRGTSFTRQVNLYKGSALVSVFVLIEEGSQAFMPTRTFDYFDLMADAAGIGLFSYLTYRVSIPRSAKSTTG